MNEQIIFEQLIQRLKRQEATSQDLRQLEELLADREPIKGFDQVLIESLLDDGAFDDSAKFRTHEGPSFDRMYTAIRKRAGITTIVSDQKRLPSFWLRSIRVSAAAILLFAISTWVYKVWQTQTLHQTEIQTIADVLPGTSQALLRLTDGRTVRLDGKSGGLIVAENGLRYADGSALEIEWELTSGATSASETWLTLETPRGTTYAVTLPDGSRVWLNAGSQLRYPVAFPAHERVVELRGEAYFEVMPRSEKVRKGEASGKLPFRVVSGEQIVEVLGTEFNVEAYPESIQKTTTLVEGSVLIRSENTRTSKQLMPGQQAVFSGTEIQVGAVDVERYVAWKSGYFKFDGSLREVMAQIARWYDVEITFEGLDPQLFSMQGIMSRDKTLDELLRLINHEQKFRYTLQLEGKERRLVIKK